ncbi:MAG: N-acetyl-gamma-glutamyl-phosphate reductase [Fibrobacteria bacterium]|nr:N-acetyl-gamma-glutamyl-phosphate reductase [Fibrobacteria bacterium]
MARIGILGATGYTGVELVLALEGHPEAELVFLSSEASAGMRLQQVFPRLSGCTKIRNLTLRTAADCQDASVDVVFSCLPHGASAEACSAFLAGGAKVIDLSADFRLRDPSDYPRWYGKPHPLPAKLSEAVYCIPELHRQDLAGASLVANPGCYPTSILLPLVPLARAGGLGAGLVIADSKSGVSGAGRKPSLATAFCETNESFSAYKVGRKHQHLGEMLQELGRARTGGVPLVFSPHLVPMERGILSTLYIPLAASWTGARVRDLLAETFAGEPFVQVLAGEDGLPSTSHVAHSNRCHIGVAEQPEQDIVVVVSVIDNLVKGASGQALQNWNALFGYPETLGLAP